MSPFELALVGLAVVATPVLIGTSILIASRERRAPLDVEAARTPLARRTRDQVGEDPIVAALGVGSRPETQRRHRAVGVERRRNAAERDSSP